MKNLINEEKNYSLQKTIENQNIQSELDSFPELLKQYYSRFFPYHVYYSWLSYNNVPEAYFCNREFSFIIKDDIYIRYQSFQDLKNMKDTFIETCPLKIDIGAVYNTKPIMNKSIKTSIFKPLEKELIFDIDLTDYDEIRICCSGSDICDLCWPFITAAIKVLECSLRDDFGFQHCFWVYSGRRGVHCWVCDPRARSLSSEQRTAIVSYLSIISGGSQKTKKVQLSIPILHSIERSVKILEPFFEDIILKKQNLLMNPNHINIFLSYISDQSLIDKLSNEWKSEINSSHLVDSLNRWNQLEIQLKRLKKWEIFKREIILHFTYPRLDINVSKQLNHLLKSPFSIHPKTKKICVPIDTEHLNEFNPQDVPTVSDLCRERNQKGSKEDGELFLP